MSGFMSASVKSVKGRQVGPHEPFTGNPGTGESTGLWRR